MQELLSFPVDANLGSLSSGRRDALAPISTFLFCHLCPFTVTVNSFYDTGTSHLDPTCCHFAKSSAVCPPFTLIAHHATVLETRGKNFASPSKQFTVTATWTSFSRALLFQQRHLRPRLIDHPDKPVMSTPTDTQEAPGHRTSRIPSRPASRRVNSDRAATSFSVSATGSPIAAATSLPARRNVPATTTASRIPTAFRTPTSTPTYSATRPPSHVGRRSAGAQPSIPRAPSSGTTPAVEVRPSSVSNLCMGT